MYRSSSKGQHVSLLAATVTRRVHSAVINSRYAAAAYSMSTIHAASHSSGAATAAAATASTVDTAAAAIFASTSAGTRPAIYSSTSYMPTTADLHRVFVLSDIYDWQTDTCISSALCCAQCNKRCACAHTTAYTAVHIMSSLIEHKAALMRLIEVLY
eukprot:10174-Heterococcus_DN1.PRE.4